LLIDPSSVVETFVSPGPAIILILFAPDQLSAAYYFSAALAYKTTRQDTTALSGDRL
jgi:hypothetical protein